ncbi:glycoside hydrolase superfamily [Cladochytrium replicatum]|nr:glycoside hydrolase superfamily [Cladochytrium replicatum]
MRALLLIASLLSVFGVSAAQSCAAAWGQCGGQGWTGATCCPSGWSCVFSNNWYSQCLQVAGSSTITTTKTAAATSASTKTTTAAATSAATKTTTTTIVASPSPVSNAFVKVSGTQFTVNGCAKYFSGSNAYYIVTKEKSYTDNLFAVLTKHKQNILRTWGFCENCSPAWITFSGNTVTLNQASLASMDYVVQQAGLKGIRLLIALTNNWSDYGGMDVYVKNLGGSIHSDFYTNANVKAGFKQYISQLLNHVNPLTGIAYKNDPTIMAWELANEARCNGCSATNYITSWADEISTYIKSIDSNHLVTTGEEGFGLATVPGDTPSNTYAYSFGEGSDFGKNLALKNIDFGTIHLYLSGWGFTNLPSDGTNWIKAHALVAKSLNKPLIIEEFGLTDKAARASNYAAWYQAVLDNNLGGVLYWMSAGADYADYDGYTLYDADIGTLVDPWTTKLAAKGNGC